MNASPAKREKPILLLRQPRKAIVISGHSRRRELYSLTLTEVRFIGRLIRVEKQPERRIRVGPSTPPSTNAIKVTGRSEAPNPSDTMTRMQGPGLALKSSDEKNCFPVLGALSRVPSLNSDSHKHPMGNTSPCPKCTIGSDPCNILSAYRPSSFNVYQKKQLPRTS